MTAAGHPAGPLRFVFGLHLHQPVGNFDHVFEQHVADVYRPLLERLTEREFFPAVLHLSGPLLEWLEAHEPGYLDQLGRLASDGRLEILLAGFYEPILASLPRADRVEQIRWMAEAVQRRFGVSARGLWLTERVWEPELAADLATAGVDYALVDDRHFLATGFTPDRLHAPFWTESDGKRVALFPIDERLRYLIPFRPPEDARFTTTPRALYQVILPKAPQEGFIVVYEFPDPTTAMEAATAQAAYLASGPAKVQSAFGTRHVIRLVGSTVVLYSWVPDGATDPMQPDIQTALETLGTGVAVPS